ncbi:MAG: hypothetical protein ACTSW6_01385 [Candidatus Baldrarchaeia archaeon]
MTDMSRRKCYECGAVLSDKREKPLVIYTRRGKKIKAYLCKNCRENPAIREKYRIR